MWMFLGRARHPGLGERFIALGQLSVEFVCGWKVDLWGSCFGFL